MSSGEPARFGVGETSGNRTPAVGAGKLHGVTAFVFDRAYACRVVAEYQSEDPIGIGTRRGIPAARQAARAEAARLNARDRRTNGQV